MGRPAPTPAELAILDPDGSFRARLIEDRTHLAALAGSADLARLRPVVHRLAGAAGTFGFAAIGELAIALDDALVEGASGAAIGPMLAALLTALAAV